MRLKLSSLFALLKSKIIAKFKKKNDYTEQFHNINKKLVFKLSNKNRFGLPIPNFRQLKYINKVLSRKEVLIIKVLIFIIVFNIIFLVFYNYYRNSITVPTYGGEYIEALVGHPQLINPVLSKNNNVDDDISRLVYSSLLKYNEKHELVLDIASAYEVLGDKKTYIIHLKNNVYWHDNEKLTADDVIFTVQLIQDPAYKSPLNINFDGVKVEKIDDYTVKFVLNEAYAPFLSNLTFGILPEHIWNNVGPTFFALTEYNIKPIGSGPYQFDSLTKDKLGNIKAIKLKRFEKFYGQKPYIDRIIFKFYQDFSSAIDALYNKNVQGISVLNRDSYEKIRKSNRFNIYKYQLPQYTALFFNLSLDNVWKEKKLRQALLFSIDKNYLVNTVLNNFALAINGPNFVQSGYRFNSLYNLQKANDILSKLGWKRDKDSGLWKKKDKVLTLTITTVNDFDNFRVAKLLQKDLVKKGFDIKIEALPFEEVKQRIKDRKFESILYGQLLGDDPDPYPFWHSTQRAYPGLNISMFANKKVDVIIEKARTTLDSEKRTQLYIDLEKLIQDEIPAIFLYTPLYNYVVDKKVKNIKSGFITLPADRFNFISKWYIKTKHSYIWK